jgi:hypothetical protein
MCPEISRFTPALNPMAERLLNSRLALRTFRSLRLWLGRIPLQMFGTLTRSEIPDSFELPLCDFIVHLAFSSVSKHAKPRSSA